MNAPVNGGISSGKAAAIIMINPREAG
jgi:hypothetical protein